MSDSASVSAAFAFASGGGVSGVPFTLYSAQPFNPSLVTVSKISMQYQQPSANNRLGSIVWRDAGAVAAMGSAAPMQGMLRCEMISDVFLGCQSEAFRSSAAASAVEDRCFSLVSRMGSLDLEAASLADAQAWLSKLSAIINESGKDIVLTAGAEQTQATAAAPAATIIPAKTATDALGPATTSSSEHWKVSVDEPAAAKQPVAATAVEEKKDSSLQNGAAAPKATAPVSHDIGAHARMVSGPGQPFLFHYLSADSKQLTRARTLLTFVSTKNQSQGSGGYFLLKTVAPSLRPTCTHACVTEPHAFHSNSADPDEHSGELCIWETRISLDVLCDVFVGSEHGLFASSPSLRGLDSSRCVSLVSDEAPHGACWDLEAPSSQEFIEWLNAFNAILQTTDQEIAVQSSTPIAVEAPAPAVATVATPAASSLDLLRAGSYFYLYSGVAANGSGVSSSSSASGSGGVHKRLILMFFNDDVSRPLFFPEQCNAITDPLATPQQQRCSLFYRFVQQVAPQSSVPLTPRPTDECISIYSISDFLLGSVSAHNPPCDDHRALACSAHFSCLLISCVCAVSLSSKQTSLLCLNPLASFAPNSACFSLMLSRLNPETSSLEPEELALECVNPAHMAAWLEGVMEVSNGGASTPPSAAPPVDVNPADKDALPLLTPQKSLPSIASYILPPGQHKPSGLIVPSTPAGVIPTEPVWTTVVPDPKSPNSERVDQSLLSIEHVVSSPRINALPPRDPVLLRLAAGLACQLWSNYASPERSDIWLFYSAVGASDSTLSNEGGKRSQGGFFFWNPLSADQLRQVQSGQKPQADSPLFKQCAHRCFNVDDVSSIYLGKLASIFAHTATASARPAALLSILTSDDLINVEFAGTAGPAERSRFLADLREVFRANLAKNLIKVEFQEDSPAATVVAASMEGQSSFEVSEWFNLQEGAYPLQLAQQPTPATAGVALPSTAVTPATTSSCTPLSPNASNQALCEFARGMEFVSWSFAPNSVAVQQVPITLFFQQTPEDHVIFFVWVPRNPGAEVDPTEVQKAKDWSRSIRHSRELAFGARKGAPWYSHLAVSAISDLHIGKNLPIFTASTQGTKLLADECVSIVASAEGAAGSVASAATLAVPVELHLVATRGITQIARIISAVTTLLELDGQPVDEVLRRVLRLGEGIPNHVLENVQALPAAALVAPPAPSAAAAATPAFDAGQVVPPQLHPLRNGSVFWLWKFASESNPSSAASAAPRAVTRQKVMLRWTPNAELGELSWTSAYLSGPGAATAAARPSATSGSMYVSSISDMFIGAEAAQFAPSCLVTSLDATGRPYGGAAPSTRVVTDDASFSIISMEPGNELHLESEVAGSPADIKTVQDWVEGLTFLLQSGGRSLTEEPASSASAQFEQPQQPAATRAAPAAEATEGRSSAAPLVAASNSPVLTAAPAPAVAPAPVAAAVAPLPALSSPATVPEVLAVVQVLQAAIKEGRLGAYTEQQLDGALAAIRDAAATQPRSLPCTQLLERLSPLDLFHAHVVYVFCVWISACLFFSSCVQLSPWMS